MKRFYAIEPKQTFAYRSSASMHTENVEYNIDILIQIEAESYVEMNNKTPEAYDNEVLAKMKEIKDTLITTGIYKDEYGIPKFMYY